MLLAALAALSPVPAAQLPPAQVVDPHVILIDAAHKIAIRYDVTPKGIEFEGDLPAKWSFDVSVDGDADGKWGIGPSRTFHAAPTADRSFGIDADGRYCPEYIFSANPDYPAIIYAASICGALPSKGSVRITLAADGQRQTIIFTIPDDEIFGTRADAHLQICARNTEQTICQNSPANPFVVARPKRP